MAHGWSGAWFPGENPVTVAEHRARNLRQLLLAFASPGCCIVLGAGASHGVVPFSSTAIAALALKMLRAQRSIPVLSPYEKQMAQTVEVMCLVQVLHKVPTSAWDRVLIDVMSPGHASLILNSVFTPPKEVPSALIEIFEVLEPHEGVIVTFNYDRIAERQRRFPVVAPHGRISSLLTDPRFFETTMELSRTFRMPRIPNDWHLLFPEMEATRRRPEYQLAVHAWRSAKSVVLIGYGFGSGADAMSFDDFGHSIQGGAPVHVICPASDNADLAKQVGYGLRGRPRGGHVYAQPFKWRPLAEAILRVVRGQHREHISAAIGREPEIARLHDEL